MDQGPKDQNRSLSLKHTVWTNLCLSTVHHLKVFLALHLFSTYKASLTCFASLPCIEFRPKHQMLNFLVCVGMRSLAFALAQCAPQLLSK